MYMTPRLTCAGTYPFCAARSNHFTASAGLYPEPIASMDTIPSWFCSYTCPCCASERTVLGSQTRPWLPGCIVTTATLHCSASGFAAKAGYEQPTPATKAQAATQILAAKVLILNVL